VDERDKIFDRGLHPADRWAEARLSLQHQHAGNTPISLRGLTTGSAPHGVLKIHLHEAVKLPVSSAWAISSLGSLSFKMNARVAMLQIASQSLKQCQNGGGRMPRNPRPDQIGMGGRMLSVQVAGSPRNTQPTFKSSNTRFSHSSCPVFGCGTRRCFGNCRSY
jgi:hypothetical protein